MKKCILAAVLSCCTIGVVKADQTNEFRFDVVRVFLTNPNGPSFAFLVEDGQKLKVVSPSALEDGTQIWTIVPKGFLTWKLVCLRRRELIRDVPEDKSMFVRLVKGGESSLQQYVDLEIHIHSEKDVNGGSYMLKVGKRQAEQMSNELVE
jgi:hypothetical protein